MCTCANLDLIYFPIFAELPPHFTASSKQGSTISIEDEVLCGMIGVCLGTRLHCQQVHVKFAVPHTHSPPQYIVYIMIVDSIT